MFGWMLSLCYFLLFKTVFFSPLSIFIKVTLKFSSTHSMISDSLLTDFCFGCGLYFPLIQILSTFFFSLNTRNSDCLAIECLDSLFLC